ncbi:DUF1648 domain-containing protein [Candidatus Micrarchaeota archaeon]|nr:DUF1648 domain-containing protein [Candidatus Micrarchaeota archaeon]MBD3418366.1 DUF1648 domain-containing protein [Candidatus Micrarchaeota archaeon]
MNWMRWIILVLLLGSIGVSAYYYDAVPEYMATHWNAAGEADGYMEKGVGMFLMPGAMLVLLVFFYLIPHIDPLKENIKKFDRYYEGFIFLFTFFLAYIHFLSVAWNIGYSFEINRFTAPVLGILFIYLGVLCGKSKQNWFIGIRTPWTLSSERVWERTHNIAKDVFIGLGALWLVVGFIMPGYILYLVGLLIVSAVILFVDSYFEYKRELAGERAEKVGKEILKGEIVEAAPMKTKAGKKSAAKKKAAGKKKAPKKKPQKKKKASAKPTKKASKKKK